MLSPAFGEGFEIDGAGEEVMSVRGSVPGGAVVKMIDIGYRYFGGIAMGDFDFVSGGELAFFDDGEVEAAGIAFNEALDHVVAVEADGDFVAGNTGLRDLYKRRADTELIADVEGIFEKALGGEVFSESSPGEVRVRELLAPIGVVLGGIGVDGFVGAAVDGEVGLTVSAEVKLLDIDCAFDGTLEDGCRNLSSLPEDDARSTDVDGNEFHPRSDSGRWVGDSGNASPAEV